MGAILCTHIAYPQEDPRPEPAPLKATPFGLRISSTGHTPAFEWAWPQCTVALLHSEASAAIESFRVLLLHEVSRHGFSYLY